MSDNPVTVVDDKSWGSTGWGAGVGGFIGSVLGNNGFFGGGWGGGGNGLAANMMNNTTSFDHLSDQITQGTISNIRDNAATNNVINGVGANITGAINQNTITGMQGTFALSDKMCGINNNITTQGYESRLQSQELEALLASQHADLSRQIFEEGCKNRELQREIQTEQLKDELNKANAKIVALETSMNTSALLNTQAQFIISQLKPATVTTGG